MELANGIAQPTFVLGRSGNLRQCLIQSRRYFDSSTTESINNTVSLFSLFCAPPKPRLCCHSVSLSPLLPFGLCRATRSPAPLLPFAVFIAMLGSYVWARVATPFPQLLSFSQCPSFLFLFLSSSVQHRHQQQHINKYISCPAQSRT